MEQGPEAHSFVVSADNLDLFLCLWLKMVVAEARYISFLCCVPQEHDCLLRKTHKTKGH